MLSLNQRAGKSKSCKTLRPQYTTSLKIPSTYQRPLFFICLNQRKFCTQNPSNYRDYEIFLTIVYNQNCEPFQRQEAMTCFRHANAKTGSRETIAANFINTPSHGFPPDCLPHAPHLSSLPPSVSVWLPAPWDHPLYQFEIYKWLYI